MLQFAADGSEHEALFHDRIYKFRNTALPYHEAGWYFHSEEVLRHKYWNIEPDQVVVDAGACFGSWTIPALIMGADVYAFEPFPLLYTELCHNASINHVYNKLHPFNKALWSKSNMILDLPHYSLTMKLDPPLIGGQPMLKVQTITMDEALADVSRLDWIKMDVEGAEIEILQGARQLIEKHNPKILVEWHADRNKDPELNYLKSFNKVELLEPGHYLVKLR